jgi:uncharacterized protein (TIGR00290 family)
MVLHSDNPNNSGIKKKISVSWSGGKDSSLMLWHVLANEQFETVELHTLLNKEINRVGLHGTHKDLIQAQADSIGLTIKFIYTEASSNNTNYESAMNSYYSECKKIGISHIAFGDIFLEDLKSYRDVMLSENGLTGYYPLWKQKTDDLAHQFIDNRFKTIICASDSKKFRPSITGLEFNAQLLTMLPENVDPCGENGEFHSFCFDGPIYKNPIPIKLGEIETHHYNFLDENGDTIKSSFEFIDLSLRKN